MALASILQGQFYENIYYADILCEQMGNLYQFDNASGSGVQNNKRDHLKTGFDDARE